MVDNKLMRVLISGGGSGGHVYPALAVVAQLPRVAAAPQPADGEGQECRMIDRQQDSMEMELSNRPKFALRNPHSEILWVGSTGRMEQALVERAGIPFRGIDTGQVRGMNPVAALVNAGKMAAGVRQSLAILREFRPEVCLATGGYVCAPVVVACRLRRVPVLIYLPDIVPGWAIRTLSLLAQRVAVTMPAAAGYFGGEAPRGKAVVTGYPLREELLAVTGCGRLDEAAHRRNRACVRRQLAERLQRPLAASAENDQPLPLVLVWGGSQGSRNINQAIWAALPQLLPHAQILHVVGERDWALFQEQMQVKALAPAVASRYHPVMYLHEEMALALAAADLTVARAGASSLGEFPIARLPSILAPLLGVNQLQNAEALAQRGAAVIVQDAQLAGQLAATVLDLVLDTSRRHRMEQALAQLAQPDAALAIANELRAIRVRTM
jgi:UDP-N-acetylglucosamine--N-acetylmuramyl-(pentapeptide) pyrophosphoryl-undecaprenol N-acetylglucosamine transferase